MALLPYLGRHKRTLITGVCAMVLAIGLSRLTPWFLKLAIDEVTKLSSDEKMSEVAKAMVRADFLYYTGLMFGSALLGGLFLFFQRWLLIGTSRRVEKEIRTGLFRHMQGLDIDFFNHKPTGEMMSHFTNDLNALRDLCGPGLMYSLQMSTMVIASLCIMISLDPWLTLAALTPYPIISLVTYYHGKRVHQHSREAQDLFGDLSARVQEDIAGNRVIRAFAQEERCFGRFQGKSIEYLEANMRLARVRARFSGSMVGLSATGLAIALLVGGGAYMEGRLSLGSFVAFTAYLIELIWPVAALGWVTSMYQRASSAMDRIQLVLKRTPSILSGPLEGEIPPDLEFKEVTFTYQEAESPALERVSFRLRQGETLGVVGPVGSGKSTLLKLILRFHDPQDGTILLGREDIKERSIKALRDLVGYAPQDSFLFSRTLQQNIAFGEKEASTERVEEACRTAGLTGDLDLLPEGLETLIGERGITLSGGQRQRASLARAFLTNPGLILLDDTLSSVDASKEEMILNELNKLLKDRTAIIVSHRISAVEHSDWILVLDEGKVVQQGCHGDLLKEEGLYKKFHERQRLAARIEGEQ